MAQNKSGLGNAKKIRWEAEKTEFYYNRFYSFILFAEMYITR